MPALFAHGTIIKYGSAFASMTEIACIKSISGPTMRSEILDVTCQQSPGAFREKLAGLIDPGQLTFEILYDPDEPSHGDATGLLFHFRDQTVLFVEVIFTDPTATAWQFRAIVVGFEASAPVDNVLTANVTLEITSEPDFAATPST